MVNVTSKDRRIVRDNINHFVHAGGDSVITLKNYARAVKWSNGYSFAEIGEEEGVSTQTIGVSVKKVVELVLKFSEGEGNVINTDK